jgi:hypothetical protein
MRISLSKLLSSLSGSDASTLVGCGVGVACGVGVGWGVWARTLVKQAKAGSVRNRITNRRFIETSSV